ncbi:MAG: protein translocase subunit SecF [bacterium]
MIDFLGLRKFFYIFSLILIIIGITSLIVRGGKNLGIDFTGGTMINLKFEEKISETKLENIRKGLSLAGIKGQIQYIGGGKKEFIVKVKGSADEKMEKRIRKMAENIGKFTYSSTYVGPAISRHLISYAIKSVILAIIAMLIYIGFRFEFRFGFAAMIALLHDIIISLGIYSLSGRECNSPTIAAFLTIVGYSVNDTIVVFDRIRENLKTSRKEDYYILINKSINQTLTRTIITSLTTLFTCITLWLFAGGDVSDFAFALTIGIAIGTFSSDCVASPILYEWHLRSRIKKG